MIPGRPPWRITGLFPGKVVTDTEHPPKSRSKRTRAAQSHHQSEVTQEEAERGKIKRSSGIVGETHRRGKSTCLPTAFCVGRVLVHVPCCFVVFLFHPSCCLPFHLTDSGLQRDIRSRVILLQCLDV